MWKVDAACLELAAFQVYHKLTQFYSGKSVQKRTIGPTFDSNRSHWSYHLHIDLFIVDCNTNYV